MSSQDWFTEWPEDALEKVASRFLEEMEMEDDARGRYLQIILLKLVYILEWIPFFL